MWIICRSNVADIREAQEISTLCIRAKDTRNLEICNNKCINKINAFLIDNFLFCLALLHATCDVPPDTPSMIGLPRYD